jgi:sialidase-1
MNQQVLAVRGVGGYRQYRIPAMAVTPSGRAIAIYDARFDFDDLPGPVDLVIRTSDDNGASWSKQEIFRKHEGISGFGDASIIVDPSFGTNGRVIVLYQATKIAGFFESTLGTDLTDPLVAHIARSISDDDGVTWRHDVITEQLKDAKTPGIFATSGMGGRITDGEFAGRLLQTFVLRREFELLSAIGFSDDHGENWQLGTYISGGNETAIAGLSDGSVLVHSRATPHRIVGRSLDGGKTLASLNPDQALIDPSDNGSLCVLKNGDVICTHNHDPDLRRNTVIKRSTDGGRTWTSGICIEPDSSAYSTACELSDGAIGVLYERNAYQEIVFAKFFDDEFQPIDSVIQTTQTTTDIEFTVVPRYIRPGRNQEVEAQLTNAPTVPEVDMNIFNIKERKEVGPAGGTTSGDSLYTAEELERILGPITPGLHNGDEVRFSARISNQLSCPVVNLKIVDRFGERICEYDSIEAGSKECILDIRQKVTIDDVTTGFARFNFELTGAIRNSKGAEISIFTKAITLEILINTAHATFI